LRIPSLDWLVDLINAAQLTHHADSILSLVKPSIRISVAAIEEELPVGVSKLGGTPDLPPEWEWVEIDGKPLEFIGQIRLEEVAPFDVQSLLPKSGILYFFVVEFESQYTTKQLCQTHYYDGELSNLRRTRYPASLKDWSRWKPVKLSFDTESTIPDPLSRMFEEFMEEKDSDAFYEQLYKTGIRGEYNHRMLGHPDLIQPHSILDSNEVELLLQVDTDGDIEAFNGRTMMWGDTGVLYYTIPREALKQKAFNQTICVMEEC
jgi:uncharacterized protein YwqG